MSKTKPTTEPLLDLINALNALTKALTLQTQAIGQLILDESNEREEPPMFDLSGKPIVIR
ncbi:hypothetical protein AXE65_11600 [Ventosimonas gracilis]|uniref:Uncharacterized protein n=1 Tax=Ventosimonas gracilis TaxID=1680762 RepID=A0A139SW73_9GAMM|nr:hypothetical protein [Ventosimonas gracilis]KXU38865.1 hypothetical protein AXE65_11600 [Ventosimonas gracilis]